MQGFDWFLVMFIKIRHIYDFYNHGHEMNKKKIYTEQIKLESIYIKKYISKCKEHCTRNFYELFHMLLSGDVQCIYYIVYTSLILLIKGFTF